MHTTTVRLKHVLEQAGKKSRRIPLWLKLAVLALLAYIVVFLYQADSPVREAAYFVRQSWVLTDTLSSPAMFVHGNWPAGIVSLPLTSTITIASPQSLELNKDDANRQPIYIWLTRVSGPLLPDTVILDSPDGNLIFMDKEGANIATTIVLTPTAIGLGAPAVVYVQRLLQPDHPELTPSGIWDHIGQVARCILQERSGCDIPLSRLDVQVRDAQGRPLLGKPAPIIIKIPTRIAMKWERFWGLVLGPGAPVLLLATALLAFAQQELGKWREQRTETDTLRRCGLIQAAADLVETDPAGAAKLLIEYRKWIDDDPDWQDPELHKELAKALARSAELKILVEQWAAFKYNRQWPDSAQVPQLVRVYRRFGDQVKRPVVEMLVDLAERPKWVQQVISHLSSYPDVCYLLGDPGFMEAISKLKQHHYDKDDEWAAEQIETLHPRQPFGPTQWPAVLPASGALLTWLKEALPDDWVEKNRLPAGCNPIGTSDAMTDYALAWSRALPRAIRIAKEPSPTFVFGPSGSGRTAATMILADMCWRGEIPGAFPVRITLSAHSAEDTLVPAIAQALLDALARDPYAFFDMPGGPRALSRLLAIGAESPDKLKQRLRSAKIVEPFSDHIYKLAERRLDRVAKLWDRILPGPIRSAALAEALCKARPAGFDHIYILVDVQTSTEVKFIQTLVKQARSLKRAKVYLKLFIPQDLQGPLTKSLPQDWVDLHWSEEDLRSLLKWRLPVEQMTQGVSEPLQWLTASACRSPRDLIVNCNQLLTIHVQDRSDMPRLVEEDFIGALGSRKDHDAGTRNPN